MKLIVVHGICIIIIITAFRIPIVHGEGAAKGNTSVPPSYRLNFSSLTIVRYNPLGVNTQCRLMFGIRLFDSSSRLFRDTFFAIGPSFKINPSSVKIGPLIEFQPIALFNVRIGYEFIRYFGTSGNLQSYTMSDEPCSDDERDDTKDNAYPTEGNRYYIEPTLQIKIGNFAARTKFGIEYYVMGLKRGDRYFYDTSLDTLVPDRKFLWTNDTDVLFINGPLTVGLRYTAVIPGTEEYHMRVGPIMAWSFNTNEYTAINKPTILFVVGWYLRHPSRVGYAPYMLLGFSFTSDFL